MKKNILLLCILAAGICLPVSCHKDAPDMNNSIFDLLEDTKNSFDMWLDSNYLAPYNIKLHYRIKDVVTDYSYNVVPADYTKSKQLAFLSKHLWLEAYETVAKSGIHFIRATAPKLIVYLGSAEHNASSGTMRIGVAEGGLKLVMSNINSLTPYQITTQTYFKTMHHEFGHILNQQKPFTTEFNTITPTEYAPSAWNNRTVENAAKAGFVTQYAGSLPEEDFVEVLSTYITWSTSEWQAKMTQAGVNGANFIGQKLIIVKNYMKNEWGVDVDVLKSEVQRRSVEIQSLDLDNLGF